ncbi:hypothetical protein D3C72_2372700 [compost metagenome]
MDERGVGPFDWHPYRLTARGEDDDRRALRQHSGGIDGLAKGDRYRFLLETPFQILLIPAKLVLVRRCG